MKRILTIAASDSGGGAGIQADLKTIALMGSFGMSAITALTAQNTTGVKKIQKIPASFIASQIDVVISDLGVDAVKTGMLVDTEVIETVSHKLRAYHITKVIVDPVMVSKSGVPLLAEEAYLSLKRELIPLAFVITPNLYEASILTGKKIEKVSHMKEASKKIYQMGAQNVLVKGGHLSGKPVDILYDGKEFHEFKAERIKTKNTHGTGCTFSAAIATEIANGMPVTKAVKNAKDFITNSIRFSLNLGKGCGPVNPYASFTQHQEIIQHSKELKHALQKLKEGNIGHLIPEVQSNLGYALPHAASLQEVFAFPGRIVRLNHSITTVADPVAGASRHVAQIILTVMKFRSDLRSAMNIRYSQEIIRKCRTLKFKLGTFDRKDEPARIKKKEGASLSWGIENLLSKKRTVPDIIYDRGDTGKEPIVRVIGKNPLDVVNKVLRIGN
jgi:hydroxymethylpyrimidine/phosphomethylpyrimidine kinase